jgi:MFS family permease
MISIRKRSLWRGNLSVMMLTSGLWTFAGQMTGPFWALYVLSLGGTYFDIGLLSAVGSIVVVLPALFGGYLADTLGRKRMVYSLSFILAANSIIYFAAPSWHWLILGLAIDAVAAGLRGPAFNALIADSTTGDNRAESYALFSIVPPLFGILSPYIIGVFMDQMGVLPAQRSAYFILFVASTVASILRLKFLKETLPTSGRGRINASKMLRESFSNIRMTVKVFPRQLWVLTVMGMLVGFGASVGAPFWATYATLDVIHLSNADWGLVTTVGMLVGTLVSLPFAWFADRRGRVRLVLPALLLSPMAIMAFVFSRSILQVFVVYVIVSALDSMGTAASQALFTDYSLREHRGRNNALWSMLGTVQTFSHVTMSGSLLGTAGNLIGGYMYGNISMIYPLLIMAGSWSASGLVGLAFLREPGERAD